MTDESIKVFRCHNCGEGMGAIQLTRGQLILDGQLSNNAVIGVRQTRVLLTDKPPQTQLFVPVLTIVEDTCEKCGCIFVREHRLGKVMATTIAKPNIKGGIQ